ncbi:MoaD/ThiS family protein [Candidatus Aminicenantes bacterium AC-335-K20]|jgi:molybdopterin converting factor small subunit|nr:MoaD/ThiS family protein [SCandidatus Aminicenantes bacterium Aminicenantia_JdfR_composite]MCP2597210.1 MoaD/ThiS family protein [Candidatus Aminicenantes bacterium AC-335-G13]MCP2598479.1 MoaD/ThiS family protein [Candidatus Aminicenantes bacterium AC-335-L06]MCP2618696.1 MoaD/ThiS family protein [Candidatus Aminicenantes bacterium AC-335-A11]MCP2619519.1 MoaD/ThiS family protein [Candidatus Aminicenantes bacterium AC-335-K20]
MKISVKVIGYLTKDTGFSEREIEIPGEITADELLSILNIKKNLPILVVRNGRGIKLKEKIGDGDRIVISPFFSGG